MLRSVGGSSLSGGQSDGAGMRVAALPPPPPPRRGIGVTGKKGPREGRDGRTAAPRPRLVRYALDRHVMCCMKRTCGRVQYATTASREMDPILNQRGYFLFLVSVSSCGTHVCLSNFLAGEARRGCADGCSGTLAGFPANRHAIGRRFWEVSAAPSCIIFLWPLRQWPTDWPDGGRSGACAGRMAAACCTPHHGERASACSHANTYSAKAPFFVSGSEAIPFLPFRCADSWQGRSG